MNIFDKLAKCILEGGAKKATKYISPRQVIKATLRGKPRKNERTRTILFTVGAPNYAERKFIAHCLRAGEPMPVKKVQLKWPARP